MTIPADLVPSAALDADPERVCELTDAGAEILAVRGDQRLADALEPLAERGVSSMIVEGGVVLHQAFWDAGLVDRVQIYETARFLGPAGVAWLPWPLPRLHSITTRGLGADTLIEAYVHGAD